MNNLSDLANTIISDGELITQSLRQLGILAISSHAARESSVLLACNLQFVVTHVNGKFRVYIYDPDIMSTVMDYRMGYGDGYRSFDTIEQVAEEYRLLVEVYKLRDSLRSLILSAVANTRVTTANNVRVSLGEPFCIPLSPYVEFRCDVVAHPTGYECWLWDVTHDEPISNEWLGYCNSRRYQGADNVILEIRRLVKYI